MRDGRIEPAGLEDLDIVRRRPRTVALLRDGRLVVESVQHVDAVGEGVDGAVEADGRAAKSEGHVRARSGGGVDCPIREGVARDVGAYGPCESARFAVTETDIDRDRTGPRCCSAQ